MIKFCQIGLPHQAKSHSFYKIKESFSARPITWHICATNFPASVHVVLKQ